MVDIDSDNSRRKHRRPWWDKAFNLFLFWTVFPVLPLIVFIFVPLNIGYYLTLWAASSIGLDHYQVEYSGIPVVVGLVLAACCHLLGIWFLVSIRRRWLWWDKAFNLFLFWTVFPVSNFIFAIVVPFYSFFGVGYLTRYAASSIGLTRFPYSVIPAVVGAVAAVGCLMLSIWFHVSIRRRWPQFDLATAHKAAYIGHRWENAHDDDDDE